jgi:hypothetical protein
LTHYGRHSISTEQRGASFKLIFIILQATRKREKRGSSEK